MGANLLAVPMTGPLTAWGLTAGIVAGAFGGPVATLLHVPTGVMVWWIESVARASARVPLGMVGLRDLLVGAVAALVAGWLGCRGLALVAPVAVLLFAAWPSAGALAGDEVARGAHVWRGDATVLVLDGRSTAPRCSTACARAGVPASTWWSPGAAALTSAACFVDLRARVPVRSIAAARATASAMRRHHRHAITVTVGRLTVRLEPDGTASTSTS